LKVSAKVWVRPEGFFEGVKEMWYRLKSVFKQGLGSESLMQM
jgi:hypothetical protein